MCERCVPNKTHPNGQPKGDEGEVKGNWTIYVIFVIRLIT